MELEKRLLALSLTEKVEVYMYLTPFVIPDFQEAEISPGILAELERRVAADRADPESATSFEDFKKRHWAHRA